MIIISYSKLTRLKITLSQDVGLHLFTDISEKQSGEKIRQVYYRKKEHITNIIKV